MLNEALQPVADGLTRMVASELVTMHRKRLRFPNEKAIRSCIYDVIGFTRNQVTELWPLTSPSQILAISSTDVPRLIDSNTQTQKSVPKSPH